MVEEPDIVKQFVEWHFLTAIGDSSVGGQYEGRCRKKEMPLQTLKGLDWLKPVLQAAKSVLL
jgi:hypothetical protein